MPSSYWLNGYTYEGENVEIFRYQPPKESGSQVREDPIYAEVRYAVRSEWEAKYDREGSVVYRKETKSTVWGDTYSETYTSYSQANGVERVVTTTYVYARKEAITQACGFPPWAVPPLPGDIIAAGGSGTVLVEKLVNVSTAQQESVINTEYRSASSILTSDGAAAIQMYVRSYTDLYDAVGTNLKPAVADALKADVAFIVGSALKIVPDKTRVQYSKKRKEESLKSLLGGSIPTDVTESPIGIPSIDYDNLDPDDAADLIDRELDSNVPTDPDFDFDFDLGNSGDLINDFDPDEGYIVPDFSVPEIDYTVDYPDLPDFPDPDTDYTWPGIDVEDLSPPYFSDDIIVDSDIDGKYEVIPSDAAEKSAEYIRIQNALRLGYNRGQSIVHPVEYYRTEPFAPVYVSIKGITGQCRTDSTAITFDETGILVSTNALFWGGVGQ